jgi:hypothetical protein
MALKKQSISPATIKYNSDISLSVIPLGSLRARPGPNPNIVSDTQFASLVHSVRENGFLQPIAVRRLEDDEGEPLGTLLYEVIDGHHRWRAAQEAGLSSVPALIVEASSASAAVDMLSLNRLRGELNMTVVADILKDLSDTGFPDLTLSGFNGGEIQSLLDSIATDTDGVDGIGEGAGGVSPDEVIQANQRYAVRLLFDKAEDRDSVKAIALRFGSTVEAGILELCQAQE